MKDLTKCLLFLSVTSILTAYLDATCTDETTWCKSQEHLCQQTPYAHVMRKQCKKTCGFCDDSNSNVCSSLGCEYDCEAVDGRVMCICLSGMRLNDDGLTCSDIDECLSADACTDPAKKVCINTIGSYECVTCRGKPKHTNYHQSDECCRQTNITGCGQNTVTGVPGAPGQDAILSMWPWTALVESGGRACTGVLISQEWIVLPAHCFSGSSRRLPASAHVGIRSTSEGETNMFSRKIPIDDVIVHESYNFPNNDIALVRLSNPVTSSWAVRPICLPNGEKPRDNGRCFLSGFEALYYNHGVERHLQDSGMTILPGTNCVQKLGRLGRRADVSNMICGHYDNPLQPTCPGETGGPIVCQRCDSCDWYVAGIFSFGDACPQNSDAHAAFLSMESYEGWIARNTNIHVQKNGVCSSSTASWRPWSSWSSCSLSCDGGQQTRSRVCYNGVVGGTGCNGGDRESRPCNINLCPRWSEYSQWSTCSATCGEGERRRSRYCINGSIGQKGCHDGTDEEAESCYERACPHWGNWSDFGRCNATCGTNAQRISTRLCIGGDAGEGECIGEDTRFEHCNLEPCYAWSDWSEWSECSVTCGGEGARYSSRNCMYGECVGESLRSESCEGPECPVFTDWSPCFATCGNGQQLRHRICNNTATCRPVTETRTCNEGLCPRSIYTEWSACSVTCGVGLRYRRTICSPQESLCSPTQFSEACQEGECPGVWSEWRTVVGCNATCGEGTAILERDCLDGGNCIGNTREERPCNEQGCTTASTACSNKSNWCQYVTDDLCSALEIVRSSCLESCQLC